jgi:CRP-like cAMP-binding protein
LQFELSTILVDSALPKSEPGQIIVKEIMSSYAVYTGPRSGFLEGLKPLALDEILAAAKPRRAAAHSLITHQGRPADKLFMLTEGRARYFFVTEEGRKIVLHWLAPGDVFGGAALLSRPSRYLISTETVKDCRLLVWERAVLPRLSARHPRLLHNALLIASDYLSWYLAAHVGLTCRTARQRLASVLVTLAYSIGRKVPRGLELDITNEDLANAAAVTPFTTSRHLSEWQRSGTVVKTRGKLLLRFPDRLLREDGDMRGRGNQQIVATVQA